MQGLLTDALVRDLTGGNLFSDAANGLFLAAPRRTGKSTFLRNELVGLGTGLKVDPAKIGKTEGLTLAEAVRALNETSGKAVALIIDEAQHALTSVQGESAMTALKSARDQLNTPDAANLLLICPAPTGTSCCAF